MSRTRASLSDRLGPTFFVLLLAWIILLGLILAAFVSGLAT